MQCIMVDSTMKHCRGTQSWNVWPIKFCKMNWQKWSWLPTGHKDKPGHLSHLKPWNNMLIFLAHSQPGQGPMAHDPTLPKIFHPTPDIEEKNARHLHSKFTPTLDTYLPKEWKCKQLYTSVLIWNWLKYSNYTKSTLDTVKYLILTLDTEPLSRALGHASLHGLSLSILPVDNVYTCVLQKIVRENPHNNTFGNCLCSKSAISDFQQFRHF